MKKILFLFLLIFNSLTAEYLIHFKTNIDGNYLNKEQDPVPPDEYWSNTVILLKGDSLGSSLVNEVSQNTVNSTSGELLTSTEDAYFGKKSLKFNGTSYAFTFSRSDYALRYNNFTLEAFVKRTSFETLSPRILSAGGGDWSGVDNWKLVAGDSEWGVDKFLFGVYAWSADAPMLTSQINIENDRWYHIAITREGNNFRMFVDGQLQDSENWSGALSSAYSSTGIISIGGAYGGWGHTKLNGYLDEVRVTKGVSRYNNSFEIPSTEFGLAE